ncbi:phosphotransferase [Neobacillus mesonae]|nr:phosphotransferase [Neobacillus mesonae]
MGLELIKEVLSLLDLDHSDYKLIGGYNNNVFEVGSNKTTFIVKILEDCVVSEQISLAESEWLNYLLSRGVTVARPMHKQGKDFIQRINNDYYFVCYEKINGIHIHQTNNEVWRAPLFENWGEAMGHIHTASKAYKANHAFPSWNENKILLQFESAQLPPYLVEKWLKHIEVLKKLPVSSDNFGLIHGDLHHGNLLIRGDSLSVIDFGDSEYHWYAYDIAIVIYHTSQAILKSERNNFVRHFYEEFMKGYVRGNSDTNFLQDINYFIQFRHLYSFTYHSIYADKSQLTEQQLEYLKNMELSLINEEPYLNLTFN